MRRFATSWGMLLFALALIPSVSVARSAAQEATPQANQAAGVTTMELVEENEYVVDIDQGESGPSAGDLRVWGPNPLADGKSDDETGATTAGTCVSLNAEFECLVNETITFADGSTLIIQGVQLPAPQPSIRTIVGGSGEYLGATGTMRVAPTEDEAKWTKTLEIVIPAHP